MIKTSRWIFHVNNMFMKQDLTVQFNVDGEDLKVYAVTKKGLRPFPKEFADTITVEGNTIRGESVMKEVKGLSVVIEAELNEDGTAEGFFKLPIFGKLKFKGEETELTDLEILPEEDADTFVDDAKKKLSEEDDAEGEE